MPSPKMLEFICVDGETPITTYDVYAFDSYKTMLGFQLAHTKSITAKLGVFYREDMGRDERRLDLHGMSVVYSELFKNWMDHGVDNSNLVTGLFVGSVGVCYGFCDGGDFFKNPEIKLQIETKLSFKKFNDAPREAGANRHHGFNLHIYPYSDLLEVDTEKGVIYAAQLKENIIAPAGEQGSSYCYLKRQLKTIN